MQEKRSGIQKESANFWTDAPNTLVAILSGNIALLQAFEKERQMEEEDEEEDLGWKEDFAPADYRVFQFVMVETIFQHSHIP